MLPEHIRVLELPHETPYIRDTAPLVRAHLLSSMGYPNIYNVCIARHFVWGIAASSSCSAWY